MAAVGDEFVPPVALRGRRSGVSAEVVTQQQEYTKKVFPKSDEEKQRLKSFISESILFSHLGPEELEEVSDSFFPVTHEPGAFIIKQGDDGDNYYIIDSGRCEIYVRPAALTTGAGNKVAEITKGGSFGELALMYNAPRAATVIAQTPTTLWALDRGTFNHILRNSGQSKRQTYVKFLANVDLLKSALGESELQDLSDALHENRFSNDDIIIRQGEVGDRFFIVLEGTAVAIRDMGDGSKTELASFQRGQCFGERALLTDEPRAANVYARGHCRVGSIEKETFEGLLGPCQDLLHRHMEEMGYTSAPEVTGSGI